MPKRTWSDAQLTDAVARSRNLSEVMSRLGLRSGGYDFIRGHIRRLGLDASHIRAMDPGGTRRPRAWSEEDLAEVVARSTSYAGVMRSLGYEVNGGIHRWIKAHIRAQGLSTEHFRGQGWSKGLRRPSSRRRPLADLLVIGSAISSAHLRRRLIDEGLREPCCETCGLSSWLGEPLPLMLDHINGDPMDNRLENLRILCPNCHAQTPTWCAGNRKRWPA